MSAAYPSCCLLFIINFFYILYFNTNLENLPVTPPFCLFMYVKPVGADNNFTLLPGGIRCIYLVPRDHKAANHVWCSPIYITIPVICLRISSMVIKHTIAEITSLQAFRDHGRYNWSPSVGDVTASIVHNMAYNKFKHRLNTAPLRPNCCHFTSMSRFITGCRIMSNSWLWTAISRAEYAGDFGFCKRFPSANYMEIKFCEI